MISLLQCPADLIGFWLNWPDRSIILFMSFSIFVIFFQTVMFTEFLCSLIRIYEFLLQNCMQKHLIGIHENSVLISIMCIIFYLLVSALIVLLTHAMIEYCIKTAIKWLRSTGICRSNRQTMCIYRCFCLIN